MKLMPLHVLAPYLRERERSSVGSGELLDFHWLMLELSALHFLPPEWELVSH